MSNNYAVINGKRIELTDEQVKALGIKTRDNPFKRVKKDDMYYTMLSTGIVGSMIEYGDKQDDMQYNAANYFNDEAFAQQVALHHLLYRKLLKFAYDNGCEDMAEWDLKNTHYYICYNYYNHKFDTDVTGGCKENTVYFSTKEDTERAIKEVVEPFMEKHPNFVW